MSCQVTADTSGLVSTPFGSGAPGGRVFGSLKLKAICEEQRAQPQIRLDEKDRGLMAWALHKLGGGKTYKRPEVTDSSGNETGFVTIESVWRVDPATIGVELNITTGANGAQTFDLDYKCRCQPNGNWTRGSVTVSFGI